MPGTMYRTVSCALMCGTRIVRVYNKKVNSSALNCHIFSQLIHQFLIAVFIATTLAFANRVSWACANVEMLGATTAQKSAASCAIYTNAMCSVCMCTHFQVRWGRGCCVDYIFKSPLRLFAVQWYSIVCCNGLQMYKSIYICMYALSICFKVIS